MIDEVDFYLIDLKSKFAKIDPKKYYLSYSGGKDSHLLYWFIKEYLHNTDIEVVAVNDYMQHPEIRKRMYKYADRVLLPRLKPFEIKEKYGSPCFSKVQDEFISRYQNGSRTESLMASVLGTPRIDKNGVERKSMFSLNNEAKKRLLEGTLHKVSNKCCYYLKKETAHRYEKESGKKAILGVRSGESIQRTSIYKSCFSKSGKFTPLHDLTDELEEAIYKKYDIEIPEVYKYTSRTGCMGCPYGFRKGEIETELNLITPNQRKFVVEYFKESYDVLGVNYQYQQTQLFE